MTPNLPRALVLILAGALLANAGSAVGAPPAGIDRLVGLTRQPSDQDRAMMDAYARYWSERLLTGDLAEIGDARRELMKPLTNPGVGIIFRDAYSSKLVPRLEPVIDASDRPMASMNAMRIVAELGTQDGLEVLIRHCNQLDEPRVSIRLWAARGIRQTLERGVELNTIPTRKQSPAIRGLGRAVQDEDDWRVLQWQLDTLATASQFVPDQVRQVAEQELFQATDDVIDKMERDGHASMAMAAIRPALLGMRAMFVAPGLDPSTQRSLGKQIAGRLVRVLAVPDRHGDAREDAELRSVYEGVIRICESLLLFVDATMGSAIGATKLEQYYRSDRPEDYRREIERIQGVTGAPPYGP